MKADLDVGGQADTKACKEDGRSGLLLRRHERFHAVHQLRRENKGQSHEELGPLVVQQVVHLNELVLQGLVGVLNRQNQEVWDAVDGPLAECLDDVEVLGEGHRNPLGGKLGLSLDKPAADPARPKGPAVLKRGCDYQQSSLAYTLR